MAFSSCPQLTAITVDASNAFYSDREGILFNRLRTVLIQYPAAKQGDYIIPMGVTSLGGGAFDGCDGLTSVSIPNGITLIPNGAFSWCTSLASVSLPAGVTSIGANAFFYCLALTNVVIPSSVSYLADAAFAGCFSLSAAHFGGNAPSIGGYVFDGDTSATVYYLPGTTGWNPQVQTGDASFGVQETQFGFTITGTSGLGIVVEACTNLTDAAWSPVQTITLTSGSFYFSDPQWTNYPSRFYRLVATSFGGLPIVLWNPQVQATGGSFGVRTNRFGFTITGTSNLVVVVEACTNLANPIWSPVATNSLTDGSSYFNDPRWTNYPVRFYRLRSP